MTSNIYDDLYEIKRRKNTSGEEVMTRKSVVAKPYAEILEIIRNTISKNHAEELSEVISSPDGQTVVKNLISKYINKNDFTCIQISDFNELVEKIFEDMAGFGFLTKYIYDPDIEEININSWRDIEVLYSEDKGGYRKLAEHFLSPQQAIDMVKKMCAFGNIIIDPSQPVKDSYIFKGTRISAMIYPLVDKDIGVSASIRRQKPVTMTREKLLGSGAATDEMLDFLNLCVSCGISVGFSGATGSGKTSNMAYILKNIPDDKRIYSIEDARELDLIKHDEAGNVTNRVIHTVTRPSDDPKGNVDANQLVKTALRFHPDIIVPAEMRGAEAWAAINAGLTGHTIVTSVHAESAVDSYDRILQLTCESGIGLSEAKQMYQIVKAFPIFCFTKQLEDKSRKIMEIIEAVSCVNGQIREYTTLYQFKKTGEERINGRFRITGVHEHTGNISDALALKMYENSASLEMIRKYAGESWEPEMAYAKRSKRAAIRK